MTTKIPVDECPAGPAMDAAIAKILNGHSFDGLGRIENRGGTIAEFCKICNKPRGYHRLWSYSTDIAAAWELFKELKEKQSPVTIYQIDGWKNHSWTCWIDRDGSNLRADANSAPLAICRAFLKAHGVEYIDVEPEA